MKSKKSIAQYYLLTLVLLMVIQGPLVLLGTMFDIRAVFIHGFLLSYLALDLILIFGYYDKLRYNTFEILLILLIIVSLVIGVVHLPSINRRHITDFLMPFSFVMKIVIFREMFSNKTFIYFFTKKILYRYIYWSFISAIILIILFYILIQIKPMYLGLTPILHPYIINNMLLGNNLKLFVGLVLAFASGKRSIILSAVIVFLIFKFWTQNNKIKTYLMIPIVILFSFVAIQSIDFTQYRAFRKYQWTYEKLKDTSFDDDTIDIVTGGRLGEFRSIVRTMNWYDYIIGKGVAYTYDLKSIGYHDEKDHANAHFTPLSIISKYGIVYYIIVMWYVFHTLRKARKSENRNDFYMKFFFLFIIAINIDFLFAFGFFTNKFFPIAMAYINKQTNKQLI